MHESIRAHARPGTGRTWKGLLAALSVFSACQAVGASFYRLEVTQQGNRYHAVVIAHLCVTPEATYAALTDFAHLPDMSPDIIKVVFERNQSANSQIVYLETRGCAGIFCHTLKQLQLFTELSPRDLIAVTLPSGSNVRYATSSWHLEADGKGTRVYWETTLEPDFWIPPVIGAGLLRSALRRQGRRFMTGIENWAGHGRTCLRAEARG